MAKVPDPTPEEIAAKAANVAAEQAAADAKAAADKAAAEAAKAADDPANWDKDRAARTIAAQREAERVLRAELAEAKKAQDELAKIKAANLTAEERAKQEAETAKAQAADAQDLVKRAHLLVGLATSPVVDPETAAALITGVEYDEEGKPTNLPERVEALVAAKSFLKLDMTEAKKDPPNVNAGSGSGDGPPPTLTVEEARTAQEANMDPAHYAALKTLDDAPNQYEAWKQIQAARAKAAGKT